MKMLDQLENFLQETSDLLAELLKDPLEEKEPSKFRRTANGDGESFGSNEELHDVGEELNAFQVGDLPAYYVGATSLILPANIWWTDPTGEENIQDANDLRVEKLVRCQNVLQKRLT